MVGGVELVLEFGQPVEAVQELVYQLRKSIERTAPRGSVVERNAESYRIIVGPSGLDLYRWLRRDPLYAYR